MQSPRRTEAKSRPAGSSGNPEESPKSEGRGQRKESATVGAGSILGTLRSSESTWNPRPPKDPPVPAAANSKGSRCAMKLQHAREHGFHSLISENPQKWFSGFPSDSRPRQLLSKPQSFFTSLYKT